MERPATHVEDSFALLLIEVGFSYREAADLMQRSDKTVKAGVARARQAGVRITKAQKERADKIRRFLKWAKAGHDNDWFEALDTVLGQVE